MIVELFRFLFLLAFAPTSPTESILASEYHQEVLSQNHLSGTRVACACFFVECVVRCTNSICNRPRISQFYQILSDFLAPERNRPSNPILLFFQFQTPVNIWKTAFSPVSTGSGNQNGFTLSQRGTLGLDGNASALLFLSMLFPVIAAIGIVVAVSFLLVDKITDYRKEIFLSTVEGEGLKFRV